MAATFVFESTREFAQILVYACGRFQPRQLTSAATTSRPTGRSVDSQGVWRSNVQAYSLISVIRDITRTRRWC